MSDPTSHAVLTTAGPVSAGSLGRTLCHEHLSADFGEASGDPDLAFTDDAAVEDELRLARADCGIEAVVEVSTYEMRPDITGIHRLAERAGLRVVKSTGWYRGRALEDVVGDRPVRALFDRMMADHRTGFEGTTIRAGVIGELGLMGTKASPQEDRAIEASAQMCAAVGLGIVLHTDSTENADAVLNRLRRHGVPTDRLLIGHLRVADPLGWQVDLALAGGTLGFDQIGHPARDGADEVLQRIVQLWDAGVGTSIALGVDVGRRSRLRKFGGAGIAGSLRPLLTLLEGRGFDAGQLRSMLGGAVVRVLQLPGTNLLNGARRV